MGLLSRVPVAPLCIITLIVGVLGICLVVSHFERPVNPRQLHSIRSGGQVLSSQHIDVNPAIKGNVFLASRTAIRATNRAYNFRAIVDALLQPPKSADYSFHKELYVRKGKATSLQFARSLGGEISAEGIDPEGNGNDEPDVWSDDQEEATTRTELEDILLVNLPLLVFFAIIFSAVEITAMLARRGRDWMLQTELWKLKETAFRTQAIIALHIMRRIDLDIYPDGILIVAGCEGKPSKHISSIPCLGVCFRYLLHSCIIHRYIR